jgi:bifunctional non-homologous end joining protein LigD
MTRNQHQITSTFPEIADALAAQGCEPCVVDGEIVAFDGSQTRFERLQQRLGQARPSEALLAAEPVSGEDRS